MRAGVAAPQDQGALDAKPGAAKRSGHAEANDPQTAMTVALGLGAAVMWAAADMNGTRATRLVGPALAMLLVLLLGVAPALVAVGADGGLPDDRGGRAALVFALLAGLAYYAGQTAMMRGVERGSLTIVGPLAALEGAVATGIAAAFGERVGIVVIAGGALAIAGACATARESGGNAATGAGWGLASALLFGVASVLWAHTGGLGAPGIVLLSRLGGLLLLAPLVLGRRGRAWPQRIDRPLLRIVAGAALLEIGAVAAATAALASGPVGVASICQSQYGTCGALLALVVFRERLARHQAIGVAATGIGVGLMALGM